ncbi:MAG: pyridoxamine 5'-phosphate oxidase family protein [Candidatus Omnitrophica bacterium]|nr:pyridoxamine 5'-phosphate oxidase family protein [Candidatus Omnitrophota bacterium]
MDGTKELPKEIVRLIKKQGFVIVSSLNEEGRIHSSAKGVVGIDESGRVFIIDLYQACTYNNLQKNPVVTVTFFDEHKFEGYALQGKAKIVKKKDIAASVMAEWEDKIIQRISKRMIKNLQAGNASSYHPEASFPHPKYLIEIDVEKIIDLAPEQLKKHA